MTNLKKILSEDVDNAAAALAKTCIKCMDFPEEGDMAEVWLFYKSFTATIVLYRRQIIKSESKILRLIQYQLRLLLFDLDALMMALLTSPGFLLKF